MNFKNRRKNAFATFVMRNDHFIPGALVFGYSLRKQCIDADIICLVTKDVSDKACQMLKVVFDHVICVDEIYNEHSKSHERQDRPFLFTRFNILRLGSNGDLGYSYDKIVLCDADILPLTNYENLLNLRTPAGILNEKKEHVMKYDNEMQYVVDKNTQENYEWQWHEKYNKLCPHGEVIPKDITDRVLVDNSNFGVTACIWVVKPDINEFKSILKDTNNEATKKLIRDHFMWVEQQYATFRWSGKWHNIDLRYASFRGYPFIEALYGTHFAGINPWNLNKEKSLRKFSRFQDYKKWYEVFKEMFTTYEKEFSTYPKLKRLLNFIDSL